MLIQRAIEARERAHAPFSHFKVGCALEAADGTIYEGCNIESCSYGLTMCAERTAVFHALAKGAREFRRMAIAADTKELTPPCGACRQVLWELCGDIELILVNLQGEIQTVRTGELLPRPFDATYLP
jgi:cytidine deaminase